MTGLVLSLLLATPARAGACEDATTVVQHRLVVEVAANLTSSWEQRWAVNMEDPAACAGGLPAPPGMEGAEEAGALVAAGRLYPPPDAKPGATFNLVATGAAPQGAHSGTFATSAGVPSQRVEVEVSAPHWAPLSVWADDSATLDVRRAGQRRTAHVVWSAPTGSEAAAWTTWKSWDEVERSLHGILPSRLARGRRLGPLGEDLEGASLQALLHRTSSAVEIRGTGSWWEARRASEVIAEGRGTAAERGLVLLSVLAAAGYDAEPALFGSTDRVSAPGLLPAPALVPAPAVLVETDAGPVWIDPATPWTRLPSLPSTMRRGLAWAPGDVAHPLGTSVAPVGEVRIRTTLRVGPEGLALADSTATLTGGAGEWARDRWRSASPASRHAEIERWVTHTWPGASTITHHLTEEGLELGASLTGVFTPLDSGMRGQVSPVFLPVLAPYVPPRVRLVEEVVVEGPDDLSCLGARSEPLESSAGLPLQRRAWVDDTGRAHVRLDSLPRGPAAQDALAVQGKASTTVLLFGGEPKAVLRSLAADGALPEAERRVLSALAWWRAGEAKKGRKQLVRAHKLAEWRGLLPSLSRYAHEDLRPWDAAWALAESDRERLELVRAMVRAGHRREAWRRASALARSQDLEVRAEALVEVARNQGFRPDPNEDREAHDAWKEPERILATAAEVPAPGATSAGPAPVLRPYAEALLAAGEVEEAATVLAAASGRDGWLAALRAEARAMDRSRPHIAVLAEVTAAVDSDPGDPRVLASASRAALRLRLPDRALEWGLEAALTSDEVTDWLRASQLALDVGDLPAALVAARRASDLAPEASIPGVTLHLLATLAGDEEQAALGSERSGYQALPGHSLPAPLESLEAVAQLEHRLALLRHRDADVRASAELLAERTRLHRDAGLWLDVGRDGYHRARHHRDRTGHADHYAGQVGAFWSTGHRAMLDASRSRVHRMEWDLVTGARDPVTDARALGDHPRAKVVVDARYRPEQVAESMGSWPMNLSDPSVPGVPAGFRPSRILSGPAGVEGWSDRERAVSVLRTDASTGRVPPPLGALYSLARPVAELRDGGRVHLLDGGEVPLYAAIRRVGTQDLVGVGFTPLTAHSALQLALQPEDLD